jgi:hypothetical protein
MRQGVLWRRCQETGEAHGKASLRWVKSLMLQINPKEWPETLASTGQWKWKASKPIA